MKKIFISLILFPLLCSVVFAYSGSDMKSAVNNMIDGELDLASTKIVSGMTIDHVGLHLQLDDGLLTFFKPILLDSETFYYAAYFKGEGRFLYEPPVNMEREQLEKFVGSDSLNRRFDKVVLLFNQEIYEKLSAGSVVSEKKIADGDNNKAKDMLRELFEDQDDDYFTFNLKSLINPTQKPYLVLNFEPEKMSRTFYIYNPFDREEVKLYLRHWEPGSSYMELINSFSQYNVDESYSGINGLSKDQIKVENYNIDASIDSKGIYKGTTDITFQITAAPLRIVRFDLLPKLEIKSVKDSAGNEINIIRHGMKTRFESLESDQFSLLFDRPLEYNEKITLSMEYEGEIADKEVGEFFVFALSSWYPKYGYRQRASFDMTFRTPKKFGFTASAEKVSEQKVDDTLITVWKVSSPASNISFSIGNFKKFKFESEDIVPVEVFYSEDLHNQLANALSASLIAVGSHMEEQVSEDVMNSLRVYEYYFGPYLFDQIKVTEFLYGLSVAFPELVTLSIGTWIKTDPWGNDRIHRAHEVAHQWWGVQVGYETYHDQWLSEGFSTYSSLMYYQRIEGVDKFLDKLKDYRSDIFSVRKYILGSGEESGPIALGYRTSSSKTGNDYGLIIYKKGAFVLHMLRNMLIDLKTMKEDRFLSMMKEYYEKYRGKEVATADFRKLAEKYVGIDLGWFFQQWVYENDLPTYDFSYDIVTEGDSYAVKGQIITKDVKENFKSYIPLEIEFDKNQKAYVRMLVDKPVFDFNLPGLTQKPKKIRLNPFESVLAKINQ